MNGQSKVEEYSFFDKLVVDACISEEEKIYSRTDIDKKFPIDAIIPDLLPDGVRREFRCKKCAAKLSVGAETCPECGTVVVPEREYQVFETTVRVNSCPDDVSLDFPTVISSKTRSKDIISKLIELHMIPKLHYSFEKIIRNQKIIQSYTDTDGFPAVVSGDIICFENDLNYKPTLSLTDEREIRNIINRMFHTKDELFRKYHVIIKLKNVGMLKHGTESKTGMAVGIWRLIAEVPTNTRIIAVSVLGNESIADIYPAVRSLGYDAGMPRNWPTLSFPCENYRAKIDALVCELGDYLVEMEPERYI